MRYCQVKIQSNQLLKNIVKIYLCDSGNASVKRKEFDNTEERATFVGHMVFGHMSMKKPSSDPLCFAVKLEVISSDESKYRRGLESYKERKKE